MKLSVQENVFVSGLRNCRAIFLLAMMGMYAAPTWAGVFEGPSLNLFVGGALGSSMATIRYTHLAVTGDAAKPKRHSVLDFAAGASFQYAWRLAPRWIGGAAISAQWYALKGHYADNDNNPRLRNAFDYGVREAMHIHVSLGRRLASNFLGYVLVGPTVGKWRVAPNNPNLLYPLETVSVNKFISGVTYGLGVLGKISPRWGVGLEVARTHYQKLEVTQRFLNRPAGYFMTHRLHPVVNNFLMRFTYGL
jgi:hypothetical protein